tara:strand:+ start:9316 stop:9597 length:282 start_codon:yes stop_codon:yes gene_type:complete
MNIFNEPEWRIKLSKMSADASNGCGLSDVVYAQNFTGAVNHAVQALSDEDTEKVLALAKTIGIYLDGSEEQIDDGSCRHGLDPHWCPAGCGEY